LQSARDFKPATQASYNWLIKYDIILKTFLNHWIYELLNDSIKLKIIPCEGGNGSHTDRAKNDWFVVVVVVVVVVIVVVVVVVVIVVVFIIIVIVVIIVYGI